MRDLDFWIKIIFVIIVVLGWVGGQFFKIFVRGPQPPAQRRQPGRPPGGPVARERPERAGLDRDVQDFLEQLRREAQPANSPAARQARPVPQRAEEGFDWEPVEPPAPPPSRPGPRKGSRPMAGSTLKVDPLGLAPPRPTTASVAESEGRASRSSEQHSSVYSPMVTFSLPSWQGISDITHQGQKKTVLGVGTARAMALREILGPPIALRDPRTRRR